MNENESPPKNSQAPIQVLRFNARELGLSLREVATDIIQQEDQNIESRWFHSQKDVDLYIWKDEKKNIIKQQVTFYGQMVEWNILEGLRTGLLIEDETSQRISSSPLIRYDGSPQRHTIEQGVEILGHIHQLAAADKIQLIENFTKTPQFSQMTPEEIVKRFGVQHSPLHKAVAKLKSLFNSWRLGLLRKKK